MLFRQLPAVIVLTVGLLLGGCAPLEPGFSPGSLSYIEYTQSERLTRGCMSEARDRGLHRIYTLGNLLDACRAWAKNRVNGYRLGLASR